jgi:hypothetical protein
MNNFQNTAAGAEAQLRQPSRYASLFLFDLKNEASEHGFKSDESWTLQLATDDEIAGLKKNYYPLVSIKLYPDVLLDVFQQVKNKLHQALDKQEVGLTVVDLQNNGVNHLAAYPARQQRK